MGLGEYLRRLFGYPQVDFEMKTPEGDTVRIFEGGIHRDDVAAVYRQWKRVFADVEV